MCIEQHENGNHRENKLVVFRFSPRRSSGSLVEGFQGVIPNEFSRRISVHIGLVHRLAKLANQAQSALAFRVQQSRAHPFCAVSSAFGHGGLQQTDGISNKRVQLSSPIRVDESSPTAQI